MGNTVKVLINNLFFGDASRIEILLLAHQIDQGIEESTK